MERISRSWALVKASWAVLRADRELIVYPLVSTLLTLVVTVVFALPLWATGSFTRWSQQTTNVADLVILFVFYLATYTVIIFCNAALVAAAGIRLNGGDPTLADGFRIAMSRLPAIVGWAAISATVGLVLRAIAERGGIVGAIGASLLGVAWNVATFLVVPILVIEGVGPVEAMKRSAGLLRKTWGEQVVGNFGIGLIFVLLGLAVVVVGAGISALLLSLNTVLGLVAIALTVLVVAVLALIGAALGGIFSIALYRYAAQGTTGGFFDQGTLQGAFRVKR
jgi:hypothetical protein